MSSRETTEVLVAGAGPTGLVLACELARRGVAFRIIDRAPARSPDSRATDIHARTLEIFRVLGVAEEIIARGKRVHAFNAYGGGRRVSQLDFAGIETPYPFTIAIPQNETEAILEERLKQLGAHVERDVELAELACANTTGARMGGVSATLRHGSGRAEQLSARFLAGCDGIGSTVRRALGIEFRGISYPERYYVADVSIDWSYPEDQVHLFMSPRGFFNVVALPGSRRARILCDYPETRPRREPTLQLFAEAMAERTGLQARLSDPSFMSSFRIQRRIAARYRSGSAFLAGDAAHTCSPLLGQGMNVGVHDAYNLGWKLALVARREASAELLDSYETERRSIAQWVLAYTHVMHSGSKLGGRLIPALRNRACDVLSELPALRNQAATICSALGVKYPRSPIVAQGGRSDAFFAPAPGDRAPDVELEGGGHLHHMLSAGRHLLLLFAGDRADASALDALARTAELAEARFGAILHPHLAVRTSRVMPERARRFALADERGALHGRYGAAKGALYLLRPDGHVAFRGPVDGGAALFAHLSRFFVERGRAPLVISSSRFGAQL